MINGKVQSFCFYICLCLFDCDLLLTKSLFTRNARFVKPIFHRLRLCLNLIHVFANAFCVGKNTERDQFLKGQQNYQLKIHKVKIGANDLSKDRYKLEFLSHKYDKVRRLITFFCSFCIKERKINFTSNSRKKLIRKH